MDGLRDLGVDVTAFAVARGGHAPDDLPIARLRIPARVAQAGWRTLGRPSIKSLVRGADVIHGTNFVLPALSGVPGVVTVHDLSFHRQDTFPGGERLRKLVPWSIERAGAVIVPTEAIGNEVRDHYPNCPDVHVTHEGVAPLFFGATRLSETVLGRMGIPGPFILSVGTLEPRKNLGRLISAWDRIKGDLDGWRLVIAGPRGWGEELPETDGVMLLGRVGDETLPGLFAAADVFCYPSLYEGFGLPPLEAMATGTATIAGRYSAAHEVLGDDALLVDPLDVDALAEALMTVASDGARRRQLELSARSRAARYTWTATARATLAAYEAVV